MSNAGAKLKWSGEKFLVAAKAEASKALALSAEVVRNQMKVNLSGPSPSKPGGFPGADTGTLSRSIFNEADGPLSRKIGTRVPHGRWMELGATITPKNTKYLPVPMNHAARRMLKTLNVANGAHVSLRTKNLKLIIRKNSHAAKRVMSASGTASSLVGQRKGSKRAYHGRQRTLFSKSSSGGKLYLVETTAGGKISKSKNAAAFVLKKKVVVAARPWCYRSAVQAGPQANATFAAHMKAGLNRALAAGGVA